MSDVHDRTMALPMRPRDHRAEPVHGWLVVLNGPMAGTDFRLVEGHNDVGAGANCHIVLTDRTVSERHCRIRARGGEFQMLDLDSTNHVYVNDLELTKAELVDNDELRVGRVRLRFKALPESDIQSYVSEPSDEPDVAPRPKRRR